MIKEIAKQLKKGNTIVYGSRWIRSDEKGVVVEYQGIKEKQRRYEKMDFIKILLNTYSNKQRHILGEK